MTKQPYLQDLRASTDAPDPKTAISTYIVHHTTGGMMDWRGKCYISVDHGPWQRSPKGEVS